MLALYKNGKGEHFGCFSYVEKNGLVNDPTPEILNMVQDQINIQKMYTYIEEMQ
jgi:hypothetical protein